MGVRGVAGGSAASMDKTFTTGLRPVENWQTALRAGDVKNFVFLD